MKSHIQNRSERPYNGPRSRPPGVLAPLPVNMLVFDVAGGLVRHLVVAGRVERAVLLLDGRVSLAIVPELAVLLAHARNLASLDSLIEKKGRWYLVPRLGSCMSDMIYLQIVASALGSDYFLLAPLI